MTEKSHEELVEFRLARLEQAVTDLGVMKEAVLRLEAKLSSAGGFLQCPIHSERITSLTTRVDTMEKTMEEMKTFTNRAIGAMAILSIIIQLVAPMVLDHFKADHQPTIVQSDSSGGFWRTNNVGP